MKRFRYSTVTLLLAAVLLASLIATVNQAASALPTATTRYVAPGGNCGGTTPCYTTVQAAVDAADPGDEIKVAEGVYNDIHTIPSLNTATFTATQVVAVDRSMSLRGGYTTGNWATPDPAAHPTILDAGGQGRVLVIIGDIATSLEGFGVTNGDAAGLGGQPWGDVGGGIHVISATVEMRNNSIFSNTSPSSGGGLYLLSSNVTLSGNKIYGNTTGWSGGGGMKVDGGAANTTDNVIHSNTGGWGGGLLLAKSDVTFDGNTVYGNTGGYGGGLNLDRGNVILNGNRIFDNTADRGGGLYFYVSSPTVKNNVISGNTCSGLGGAIFLYSSAALLTNNVVADNATSQDSSLGAGLYVCSRSSPTLLHNTIARNKGKDGSGIYVDEWYGDYSSIAMTNTIISGHKTGVMATAGNSATLESTLWHGNTDNWAGAGVINHSDDHSGDPKFAFDGYHLSLGSAAIDKGADAGVTVDIDGKTRPWGGGYDLGADEFDGIGEQVNLFLPLAINEQ